MIQPVGMVQQAAAYSFQRYGAGIAQVFRDRVAKKPNQVAIVYEGTRVTYSQLFNRALSVASQLLSLGIKKGDKVGLLYTNSPEFASLFFAIVGIGAVVVPINPLLKTDEIAHILTDSDARVLIAHDSILGEVVDALPKTELLEYLIVSPQKPDNFPIAGEKKIQLESLTEAAPPAIDPFINNIDLETDLAFIVYTSGTTGKPKGAMISHANLLSVLPYPLLSDLDLQSSDVWLGMLPLCHVYGLAVIVFGALTTGGTIVILPRFEPKAALEAIERERVTVIPAVPAMYQFMLMELSNTKYDVSSVRVTFSGAAPASRKLLEQVEAAFGSCAVEGYGLSETACGATLNRPHARKMGSVGRAVPGISIEIRDPNGRALPRGAEHVGEITIKGNNIMVG
ncbi:MAG: AMP-binding protein, partial [Cyanobacteria bacterium]|nr:AMP-binding protein [Cyanobacteriota bacterium]